MVQRGVALEKVFKIASWANKLYWTTSSTMAEGVEGMKSAANDLYGGGSEYTAVGEAFESVGLGTATHTATAKADTAGKPISNGPAAGSGWRAEVNELKWDMQILSGLIVLMFAIMLCAIYYIGRKKQKIDYEEVNV
eukprot:UN06457